MSEEKEKITFTPDGGGFAKLLLTWKEFPLDQWHRELILGNRIQAHFKMPEKDICDGEFHKILSPRGIIYICDKCFQEMAVTSHRIFYKNAEIVIQLA